jgi:hypothetical protein
MKRTSLPLLLVAAVLVVAAALPAAQAAGAQPDPPSVPSAIQVQGPYEVFLVGHAEGVQIYGCKAAGDGYAWSLVAPRANLYDDRGKLIITHFAGPKWKARDGSTVLGARVDGVPAAGTIPWLLLSATPATNDPEADRLTGTKFIQRVNTTGGVAPAASTCTADTAGAVEEIDYTADYYFWRDA